VGDASATWHTTTAWKRTDRTIRSIVLPRVSTEPCSALERLPQPAQGGGTCGITSVQASQPPEVFGEDVGRAVKAAPWE